MAGRAKAAAKRGRAASKFPKVPSGELATLLDFVRYAVSRFVEAKLVFAHGTTDPVAEAAFLVCETLHLHPDQFEILGSDYNIKDGLLPELVNSKWAGKLDRGYVNSKRLYTRIFIKHKEK